LLKILLKQLLLLDAVDLSLVVPPPRQPTTDTTNNHQVIVGRDYTFKLLCQLASLFEVMCVCVCVCLWVCVPKCPRVVLVVSLLVVRVSSFAACRRQRHRVNKRQFSSVQQRHSCEADAERAINTLCIQCHKQS